MERLNKSIEAYSFSGLGEIYSFTTVFEAPSGYEEFVPYVIALIKLKEGVMITAQVTDLGNEDVYIGMKVEMITRKIKSDGDRGIIVYGYKFRPIVSRV